MELTITCGVILLLIGFTVIRGKTEEKRQREKYREKLKEQYGKFPQREYKAEDLEKTASMFLHKKASFSYVVDDITWNDLDMDRVFKLMNHTQSSSGAEYLYCMLRTPELSCKGADIWEKHVRFFMHHESQRMDIQMLLHELGRTGRFPLHDYLNYLDTIKEGNTKREITSLVLLLLSFALIFVYTPVGVILFLVLMCMQISSYLKRKSEILPYLSSFAYIMRMIACGEKISRENLEGISDWQEELKQVLDALSGFKQGYGRLKKMSYTTGNPVDIIVEYLKMLTHLDLIQFNLTIKKVKGSRHLISKLAERIGYLDAVIATGAFRASLPYYCIPCLSAEKKVFQITDGYHPSIKNAVPNSFRQEQGMLITGSNASGKSTFLRMTAVNAILAQTIHTCTARRYEGNYFCIYSSMALRDSLESGESYYMVEIKALKRIMDAKDASLENPMLCFVDEVLRGTNTVERIAASAKILEMLAEEKIFCFAATHDIELTHLLEKQYDNFHFEEEVEQGDVCFSYHLQKGRATSRNAIRLLQIIGFEDKMIENAEKMATEFMKTGEWRM